MPLAKQHLGTLVLLLAVAGCARGPRASLAVDAPAGTSRLTGRWFAPFPDAYGFVNGGPLDESERGSFADERVLFVTILPDGSFDWSRTWIGVMFGLRDLRDLGDRSTSWGPFAGEYEVTSADYTPDHSAIRFQVLPAAGSVAMLIDGHLEVRRQPDGRLRALISTALVTGSRGFVASNLYELGPSVSQLLPYQIRRTASLDLQPFGDSPALSAASELAGAWGASAEASEAQLVVRPDGTIDWSGTVEGQIALLYQLEAPGDRASGFMGGLHTLINCAYEPRRSWLRWQTHHLDDPTETSVVDLEIRKIGNDRVRATLQADGHNATRTLYRCPSATSRPNGGVFDGINNPEATGGWLGAP